MLSLNVYTLRFGSQNRMMKEEIFKSSEKISTTIIDTEIETGKVTIQAVTIPRITFQSTAVFPRVAPTPAMDPLMICVDEVGIPDNVRPDIISPPAVDAQNP